MHEGRGHGRDSVSNTRMMMVMMASTCYVHEDDGSHVVMMMMIAAGLQLRGITLFRVATSGRGH